jgi:hypothetical protein
MYIILRINPGELQSGVIIVAREPIAATSPVRIHQTHHAL